MKNANNIITITIILTVILFLNLINPVISSKTFIMSFTNNDDPSRFATYVVDFSGGGNTELILGGPYGKGKFAGSIHVLSLGPGGSVTVGFDVTICDGLGYDFIVFENPFFIYTQQDKVFAELVYVEVSTDGEHYAGFPSRSITAQQVGAYGGIYPENVTNLAGVWPVYANVDENDINPYDPQVAGGDPFDLHDLCNDPLVQEGYVDLQNINYIKIVDVIGDGGSYDSYGHPIYDATWPSENGADIDAISVVNIASDNYPPETPIINGPDSGEPDVEYTYSIQTTDPNGDDVHYYVDWGDYSNTGWIGPYHSGEQMNLCHIWFEQGIYIIRVKAKDVHQADSHWTTFDIEIIGNRPPNTPTMPSGQSMGVVDQTLTFSTSTDDPDNDSVRYGWDWDGNEIVDEWTSLYSSGTTVSTSHIWTTAGTYNVKVKAKDSNGAESDWSSAKTVVISSNNPPNKPSKPSGPASGKTGISYTYSSSATDPNGDQVYLQFDWADGTNSRWLGPYSSGQTVTASHLWTTANGTYQIKVKAKDDPNGDGDLSDGTESVWSDPLSVSMPKTEKYINIFVLRFLENHPYIFPLLRRLLELQ